MFLSTNSSVQQSLGQYLLGIENSSLPPPPPKDRPKNHPPPQSILLFGSLSVWLNGLLLEEGNGNRYKLSQKKEKEKKRRREFISHTPILISLIHPRYLCIQTGSTNPSNHPTPQPSNPIRANPHRNSHPHRNRHSNPPFHLQDI